MSSRIMATISYHSAL